MSDSDGWFGLELADLRPRAFETGPARRIAVGLAALATLAAFLFAVRLLGAATEAAAPLLERLLARVVRSDAGALGAGWLATYLLANGSVVAALSLTLFAAGVVPVSQAFLLVAGSRLGGASVVLLVGGLEFLRRRPYSLRKATSLGVLAFLLTLSVYLPAVVLGYLTLPAVQSHLSELPVSPGVAIQPLVVLGDPTRAVVALLGPAPSFVAGLALLYACLEAFDRLLGTVDPSVLRRRFFGHLDRRWLSFFVGVVVTGVTTSVAFSLGVVVAPYNRGYVTRREIVPYVLGANVGTLLDTVVVALVLGTGQGALAVLALIGWSVLLTLGVLVAFGPYFTAVEAAQDRLLEDRRWFLAFLLALAAAPLVLVAFP